MLRVSGDNFSFDKGTEQMQNMVSSELTVQHLVFPTTARAWVGGLCLIRDHCPATYVRSQAPIETLFTTEYRTFLSGINSHSY